MFLIMRDVNYFLFFRYLHANTAFFFFIFVYFHIGRGLYYEDFSYSINRLDYFFGQLEL